MKRILLLLAWMITCWSRDQSPPPPGHLRPLGSHVPPIPIQSTREFPDPLTFHSDYVAPQQPVIFKGLILQTDAYTKWQSDQYLKENFGQEEIGAENGKKENRSEAGSIYKFEDFLNAYNTSDIYMVNDMPEGMKDEWPLPNFLLCGGYTDHMAYINVWFSSGGTKSVLHSDSMENFHCVVSGRKEFIMFEPRYSQDIGPEHEQLGYYHIDVDSVDMLKYTNLSSIPWYKAVIDSGDCLYLPYHWLHQVNSYGRNLGVNVWWIPFQFNEEECEDIPHVAGFATISQFQTTPELQVRQFLLDFKRDDGTIHASDIHFKQKDKGVDLPEDVFDKIFDILVEGCNGTLHVDDLRGDGGVPVGNYKLAMDYVGRVMDQAIHGGGEEEGGGDGDGGGYHHHSHYSDEL